MAEFNVAKEQQAGSRVPLIDRIPLDTPLSMQLELASACNFKCKFCMHHDDENIRNGKLKPGIMSMEVFEDCIRGLKSFPHKLKYITLQSRGESLLNKKIVLMLRKIKAANVTERVGLYTNGTLLTEEMSDGLIREGLDTLHISIEGVNDKQYKAVTGTDVNFGQLVDNVRYFYKHKASTYLYVKIIDYDLTDEDKKNFVEIFKEISDDLFIEEPVDAWKGAGIDTGRLKANRYGEDIVPVQICPRLFFAMVVHYDGTVVACDHDWSEEEPIGNVRNQSLLEIWNGSQMRELRKLHICGDANSIIRCRDCIQRRACLPGDNIDKLRNKPVIGIGEWK